MESRNLGREHNISYTSEGGAPPPPYEEVLHRSGREGPSYRVANESEIQIESPLISQIGMQSLQRSNIESQQKLSTPAILLMGPTGAGKSSFTASATGLPVGIGHTLEPHTIDPQGWSFTKSDGTSITLIDTPGFNDTKRPDTDLLQSIIAFILQQKFQIVAVIYIYPITERKLTGSTLKNLRVLRAICGEHYFQNMVLVTSMWTKAPVEQIDEQVDRELQFNSASEFWGDILEKGATYCRWDDTGSVIGSKKATEIIHMCEGRKDAPKLAIFLDMEKTGNIQSTTAFHILTEELRKREERERQAMINEEEDMKQLQSEKAKLEVLANKEKEECQRELFELRRLEESPQSGFGSSPREDGRSLRDVFSSFARPNHQRRSSESAAAPRSQNIGEFRDVGQLSCVSGANTQTRNYLDSGLTGGAMLSRVGDEREMNYESGAERPERSNRRRRRRLHKRSDNEILLVRRKR